MFLLKLSYKTHFSNFMDFQYKMVYLFFFQRKRSEARMLILPPITNLKEVIITCIGLLVSIYKIEAISEHLLLLIGLIHLFMEIMMPSTHIGLGLLRYD